MSTAPCMASGQPKVEKTGDCPHETTKTLTLKNEKRIATNGYPFFVFWVPEAQGIRVPKIHVEAKYTVPFVSSVAPLYSVYFQNKKIKVTSTGNN